MYYVIYIHDGKFMKKNSENWEDMKNLPNIIDLFKSDSLTLKDFNDMFFLMRSTYGK